MSKLYNRQVCWPMFVQRLVLDAINRADCHQCQYSFHAKLAANNDKYGAFTLPLSIHIEAHNVVEADITQDVLVKLVVRLPLDEHRNICLVLVPKHYGFFVKTVWINLVTDQRQTLQRHRYCVQ
jgi:hypothetical protein